MEYMHLQLEGLPRDDDLPHPNKWLISYIVLNELSLEYIL